MKAKRHVHGVPEEDVIDLRFSDYAQSIVNLRSEVCRSFIGYCSVRLITTTWAGSTDIMLLDDFDAEGRESSGAARSASS